MKIIFKNKKIRILDIGASDGISALYFIRNLNPIKIDCYEPHPIFYKQLIKLKKKYKIINIFNFAISKTNKKLNIYYPIIKIFFFRLPLFAYTYYVINDLKKQINLDFIFKSGIVIEEKKLQLRKYKKSKIKYDLVKIDTNGYEHEILISIYSQLIKDKPVIILENSYMLPKINQLLSKLGYKKYFFENDKIKSHKREKSLNIIFLNKKILKQIKLY